MGRGTPIESHNESEDINGSQIMEFRMKVRQSMNEEQKVGHSIYLFKCNNIKYMVNKI